MQKNHTNNKDQTTHQNESRSDDETRLVIADLQTAAEHRRDVVAQLSNAAATTTLWRLARAARRRHGRVARRRRTAAAAAAAAARRSAQWQTSTNATSNFCGWS